MQLGQLVLPGLANRSLTSVGCCCQTRCDVKTRANLGVFELFDQTEAPSSMRGDVAICAEASHRPSVQLRPPH